MSEVKTHPALPRNQLGRTGFQLSIVSAGGWLGLLYDPAKAGTFGGVTDDRAAREAAAEQAVRRAIGLGIKYFDTAPIYSGGEAERLLGVGLRAMLATPFIHRLFWPSPA
jgi:aryl-alcohol dehydrogenase-like predicted oxidoreductase